MGELFQRARKQRAAQRTQKALKRGTVEQKATLPAAQVGNGLVSINGQLYPGTLTDGGGSVVNLGNPAAALYGAGQGGGGIAIIGSGGSSSVGGGGISAQDVLDLIAGYLPRSGASAMYGDLNMGGRDVTNVSFLDGVDLSAHVADPNAHHYAAQDGDGISVGINQTIDVYLAGNSGLGFDNGGLTIDDSLAGRGLLMTNKVMSLDVGQGLRFNATTDVIEVWGGDGWAFNDGELDVGAGDGIDVFADSVAVDVTDILGAGLSEDNANNIQIGPPSSSSSNSINNVVASTHSHAVIATSDGAANPGSLLKSGELGELELSELITNLITTQSGDLQLSPAQFTTTNKTIASDDWFSGVNGWGVTPAGVGDFRELFADKLTVVKFISDINLALAGSQITTKSLATLARDFTVPAVQDPIYSFDLPGSPDSQTYETGDWLRLRYVERGTGLIVGDVWGTVSLYVDQPEGEQSWTFSRQNGTVGKTIHAGMIALDYGQSGDGYIHQTTLQANSPYIDVATWVNDPSVAANHTVHVRIGNLNGIADADLLPGGWGIYTDNAFLKGDFVAGAGEVRITEADGITISSEQDPDQAWTTTKSRITFSANPQAPALDNIAAAIWGLRAVDVDTNEVNALFNEVHVGDQTGANKGAIYINVQDDQYNSQVGLTAQAVNGAANLYLFAYDNILNTYGNITLFGTSIFDAPYVRPVATGVTSLGAPAYRFKELHVDTIFAGTTSSTDTGHNHNNAYYTEAEIDASLAGKAATAHSHANMVTTGRNIITGNGLSGGGSLAADRTLVIDLISGTPLGFTAGDLDFFYGSGLHMVLDELRVNANDLAGAGLTVAGEALQVNYGLGLTSVSGQLRVNPGSGISVGSTVAVDSSVARNTWAVNAGTALTGGGVLSSAGVTLNVNYGTGLDVVSDALLVKLKPSGGILADANGLYVDVADSVGTTTQVIAGAGLTGGGALTTDVTLNVGAGVGIDVAADTIAVDVTDFLDTAYGLTEAANAIRINLAVAGGLSFLAGALQLDDAIAGVGLTISGKVLAVGAGDGLNTTVSTILVDETVARNTWNVDTAAGLTGGGNLSATGLTLAIALSADSGLTTAGNTLALGLPTSLGVASTNDLDLTSHTHAIASSSDPGAAAVLLATSSAGSLYLDGDTLAIDAALDAVWVNAGLPDGSTAFMVQSASVNDATLIIKALADQVANVFGVQDAAGNDLIVLSATGALQSGNPGFVSGQAGWQISADGTIEANNLIARGEIRTAIFTKDETQIGNGTMLFATGGRIKADVTIAPTGTFTIDIEDEPYERGQIASIGDILNIRSGGATNALDTVGPDIAPSWEFWFPVLPGGGTLTASETWLKVTAITDMTTFYRYTVAYQAGSIVTYLTGTALANFGPGGEGKIKIAGEGNYSPYLEVFTPTDQPWTVEGIIPHVRLGRLDGWGLPELAAEQYGLAVATDATDANSPRLIASNLQFRLVNIDMEMYDGAEQTVSLTNTGILKLGSDVSLDETTWLYVNPNPGGAGGVRLRVGDTAETALVYVDPPTSQIPSYVSLIGRYTLEAGHVIITDSSDIWAGTVDEFDVEQSGIRFWNSGSTAGFIGGYASTVKQWELSNLGLDLFAATPAGTLNPITWRNGANENVAKLYTTSEADTLTDSVIATWLAQTGDAAHKAGIKLYPNSDSDDTGADQLIEFVHNSTVAGYLTRDGAWALRDVDSSPNERSGYSVLYYNGTGVSVVFPNGARKLIVDDADPSTADSLPQYAYLAGRAGGQSYSGGNAANDDLRLQGTTHATRTSSYLTLQENGGLVGIGIATPLATLQIAGATAGILLGGATTETGPYSISVPSSGTATPATKGTGDGRNLIISAGASDNTGGLEGGDLYLRPGAPSSPATLYGNVLLADLGGNVHVGGTDAPVKFCVDGESRIRKEGDTRYRAGYFITGSNLGNLYAYDDTGSVYIPLYIDGSQLVFRTGTGAGNSSTIDAAGSMGVGTVTPQGKLDVNQLSTTAAIPVLELEQADLSEEFINFVGTVGAGNAIEADTTPAAATTHKVRVAINGSTLGYLYIYAS